MLATFVIFLREGVEASMIVAILLAYLNRSGQRRHFRDVFGGVAAALLLAGTGGLAAYFTIRTYAGSRVQTIFETVTYLLAAAVLTYMTFWMRSHARGVKSELQARGVAGLAIAMVIAFVMYRLGHRINIGRFFTVVGVLLMIFAAGLLVDAVQNMQELGWLPGASHQLWHTGAILNEDSAIGDIAHSFFGYAQSPTVLQVVVYGGYLACVLFAFFSMRQRIQRRAAAR